MNRITKSSVQKASLKLILLICFQLSVSIKLVAQESGFKNISPTEAKAIIDTAKNILILDVRTVEEFNSETGHLQGAVNIPIGSLEAKIGEIEKFKDAIVLVYCRSGNRSRKASQILVEKGFKHIYNLSGGIIEWNQKIREKAKNEKEDNKRHHD